MPTCVGLCCGKEGRARGSGQSQGGGVVRGEWVQGAIRSFYCSLPTPPQCGQIKTIDDALEIGRLRHEQLASVVGLPPCCCSCCPYSSRSPPRASEAARRQIEISCVLWHGHHVGLLASQSKMQAAACRRPNSSKRRQVWLCAPPPRPVTPPIRSARVGWLHHLNQLKSFVVGRRSSGPSFVVGAFVNTGHESELRVVTQRSGLQFCDYLE